MGKPRKRSKVKRHSHRIKEFKEAQENKEAMLELRQAKIKIGKF